VSRGLAGRGKSDGSGRRGLAGRAGAGEKSLARGWNPDGFYIKIRGSGRILLKNGEFPEDFIKKWGIPGGCIKKNNKKQ